MGDYKINTDAFPPAGSCKCEHPAAAHGSKGMICAVCPCRQFILKEKEDGVNSGKS